MNNKSNIIAKIKELFAEQKMAEYTATSNEIIRCLGDFAVGTKVVQVVGGEETTLPDGMYPLDNGKSIVVESGTIKEINDYPNIENKVEAGMKEKMEEEYKNEIDTKTIDGTEVKIKSKGDSLSVGDLVMVKDSSGNFVQAPSGKHELEGGLTIYVDEQGFINELETAETDKTTEQNETEMKTMFEAVSSLKTMIDSLKGTIEGLKKENEDLKSKFEKFSKSPSTESITKKQEKISITASKWDKAKSLSIR
jgi:predicted RNase H-like nuclease (RuvC/YqgF family)